MKSKYEPKIPPDVIRDMIKAQRAVRKALRNQTITMRFMKKLIRSWQGELGHLRRRQESERVIRIAELSLAFLKATHEDNLSRYEAYCEHQ